MTRKNDRLTAKRHEALRAMRLNQRKINRLENTLNRSLPSDHRPRQRSREQIARLTEKQLDHLIADSEKFRDRKTQFKKLANNEVITQQRWNEFNAIQQKKRRQTQQEFDKIDDFFLPSVGKTIGEQRKQNRPDNMRNMAGNIFSGEVTRTPEQIASPEALERIQEKLLEEVDIGQIASSRKNYDRMFEGMHDLLRGNDDVLKALQGLSDRQVHALWSVPDFAGSVSAWYEIVKANSEAFDEADQVNAWVETATTFQDNIMGLIDDIKRLKI